MNNTELQAIIAKEIYCMAPVELVEALHESEEFIDMHCINLIDENGDSIEDEYQEIFEYYLVSDYLGDKLRSINEPVMDLSNCSLWGRTCTGQSIELDGTIQKAFSK
jgi:hypothetical protein